MKHLLILAVAITIGQSNSFAQTPSAHFKFDNSLNEFYSNSVLDATTATFTYDLDETGAADAAVNLTDGYFTMADPAFTQFGTNDFSFSLWFKRTDALWPEEWLVKKETAAGYMKLRYNGFFDQMVFHFQPDVNAAEMLVSTPASSVGEDVWNLITVTVDRDGTMIMYQNGQAGFPLDISQSATAPASFIGGVLEVACLDIVMNDLLFFNSALTAAEVMNLYNHELNIDDLTQNDFVVYPNPVVKTLKIKSEKAINEPYEIFSVSGELIQKGTVENNEIEIGELASGNYLLSILGRSISITI